MPRRADRELEVRRRRTAAVGAIKEAAPCTDCGNLYPACCMDFDHLDPATKQMPVARMVSQVGIPMDRVMREIAKCELVCANCHRIRTRDRK